MLRRRGDRQASEPFGGRRGGHSDYMKLILLMVAAVTGYVTLRRKRPGLAQQVEGRAKKLTGKLRGRNAETVEGSAQEFSGTVRDDVQQSASV
jgi:uncharacterized protein YjbJ (UPF0337 family)